MVTIDQQSGTNILITTATGELEQSDYDRMLPKARAIIAEYGSVRWLFEMVDFDGWTAGSAWRDLKFDVRHASDFERVAIVGKKAWMEWISKLTEPFTSAEVQHFEPAHRRDALAWLAER